MTPFQAAKCGILGFGLATKPQKEAACDRNGVKGFLPLNRAPREMFHEPTITVAAGARRTTDRCRQRSNGNYANRVPHRLQIMESTTKIDQCLKAISHENQTRQSNPSASACAERETV